MRNDVIAFERSARAAESVCVKIRQARFHIVYVFRPPRALSSEIKFRGQLNAARSSAAQKRIADTHIACSCDWIRTRTDHAIPCGRQTVGCRVSNEVRQFGTGEVRVVDQVKELSA